MEADVKTLIESMPETTLAAKLRALMPAIDQRIRDGVSYKDIVDALNLHGGLATPVKFQTFRSYLFRYRKKAARVQPRSAETGGRFDPGGPGPSVPRISNASDLKRLRNEEVDLEELSRIGRNRGGG